ncbi:class I SAM-dependent methyltransferase [Moritella viscosa]|uniref:class I SAM-dependent methyltransferase n=1 Tax=Moritella viscosa TaxID=80854 RepID=UPI000916A363|nr:class I SAM-dependent methyltransferase [Moritella viscosa]SHO16048.1 Putative N6 adenine-specific DNA methyltransferase, probably truncated [Moritella viscosa]SHO18840.1 Putative N6 adenine-specific DNA methyltransferase, probably truncated [Moritella viscosa]
MKHLNKDHSDKKESTIYTPKVILDFLHKEIIPFISSGDKNIKVFDPAIGKGALTNRLKSEGAYVIGNDIDDVSRFGVEADELYVGDFEVFDKKIEDVDLIIVNPPFNGHHSRKLYPEVFSDKAFEVCGFDTPMIAIMPIGWRTNNRIESKRWRKVRDTYNQISSIVSLPLNIFEGVLVHTEIIIFNVDGIKPHYFLDNI